jgi:glutaminyl-peptide cyclotransferase
VFVYDKNTFIRVGELGYQGEGWGLCHDGRALVMSDGSDALTVRAPDTFAITRTVKVTQAGRPLERINELECVGGDVYANVWMTDSIVRIDMKSGQVNATMDASGLLTPAERQGTDVLNGIAYDPADRTFLITGKLWPKLFRVKFEP